MPESLYKNSNPVFDRSLLHPRHWLTWIAMFFWWLLIQLPYPVLMMLGKITGRLLGRFEKDRIFITRCNLQLCFPDLTPVRRERLMRECFDSAGIALFETAMSWWWPNRRLAKFCSVKGLEHLQRQDGKNTLLLGMHFTAFDIGNIALAAHNTYGMMYRPHRNPVFNYLQFRGRSRSAHKPLHPIMPFPRKDPRTMVRLLKQGIPVWYAPDQDYGKEHSVFVPFFGVMAATITATARIAHISNAAVLPYTVRRLPACRGYEITLHPPLPDYPSGDDAADATRINAVIEKHIRQNPGQYLWAHRRFKTKTTDMPERYPDLAAKKLAQRRKQWHKKKQRKLRQERRQKKH